MYNPTSEAIEAKRNAGRDRQRNSRATRAGSTDEPRADETRADEPQPQPQPQPAPEPEVGTDRGQRAATQPPLAGVARPVAVPGRRRTAPAPSPSRPAAVPPTDESLGRMTDDLAHGFLDWWALQLRPEKKALAAAWWADTRPDPETIDRIMIATRRSVPGWRRLKAESRPGSIPQPINWLNDRCYEDAA